MTPGEDVHQHGMWFASLNSSSEHSPSAHLDISNFPVFRQSQCSGLFPSVVDAEVCDGSMLVADCLPRQPSSVMVCTVAVHMNVTVGVVALLQIKTTLPTRALCTSKIQ